MKIISNIRRRQQGLALWAAIILFCMFLVFIGTLAYVIVKAIQRMRPRQPPPIPAESTPLAPDVIPGIDHMLLIIVPIMTAAMTLPKGE